MCQSSCPASTANHPTIGYNVMKGAFYMDVGASFEITKGLTLYGKVDNLFDRDPTPASQTNTGLDINPPPTTRLAVSIVLASARGFDDGSPKDARRAIT